MTQPHFTSLSSALAPLLTVANAGGFHLFWSDGVLTIEQGDWSGVNFAAIQTAVDAAPAWTEALTAKDVLTVLTLWEEAIFRVLLDLINGNRTALGKATLSAGAFFNLVKTKIDTL